MVLVDMGEKSFHLRSTISIIMDVITLEGDILGISSVSMGPILDENVNVEHFINEKTHIPNTLRF